MKENTVQDHRVRSGRKRDGAKGDGGQPDPQWTEYEMQSVDDEWIARQDVNWAAPKPSAAWSNWGRKRNQTIKPKRTAEQQVADEADRRALNPLVSRQKIPDQPSRAGIPGEPQAAQGGSAGTCRPG